MRKIRFMALMLAMTVAMQSPLSVMAANVSDNQIKEKSTEEKDKDKSTEDKDKSTEEKDKSTEELINTEEDEQKEAVRDALLEIVEEKPIYALVYNADHYELKVEPKKESEGAGSVISGTQVSILDIAFGEDGKVYLYVDCYQDGSELKGYIESSYLATADTEYNEWKDNELIKINGLSFEMEGSSIEEIYRNFPSGYWGSLINIAQMHPNWIFAPFNSGVDWNSAVAEECQGNRSLAYKNSPDEWFSKAAGDYDPSTGTYIGKSGSNWYKASEYAISYCMNPMNYMNEKNIFAFEQLTYNQDVHNASGVAAIISGTWMSGRALEDGSGGLYQDVFIDIGAQSGVSPYHLASRVRQEQGIYGGSKLISGVEGFYNYFNIKASGGTEDAIYSTGINYAKSQGWNTRYASILGGAQFLGANYISKGQDTLYLQKYDIDNSYNGMYNHQYMQNIQAPMTESVSVYSAYNNVGALNNNFVFKIPVYVNMPGSDNPSAEYPVSEDFIKQLYSVILGRMPDTEGLEYWKTRMKTGSTAADLITGFFDSDEMTNRNLNNADYLVYAYRAILGRDPDASGKQYWLDEMAAGCTRKCILTGFVESTEFYNMCKEYGIVKGSITALSAVDKNAGMTKFVVRLYRKILSREPDAEGLEYWTAMLQNGYSACALVEGFVYSQEFANANLNNSDYVEILYETMLGRASDKNGKADWVGQLNRGTGRNQVLAGFVYSTEFNNLCKEYGITIGNLSR